MKRSVLHVKKGTSSYDDREDRLEEEREAIAREKRRPPIEGKRRSFSFLRMRRGSLVPLLVLVLIGLLILRVLPRSAARANIAGWHAVLQARVFADTLRVGVAFSRLTRGAAGSESPGSIASVLFILPDTGEQEEASGTLAEPHVALRSQMRYIVGVKTLRAIVMIDGQSRTLSLAVRGP